jgi:hypothetical protein
VGYHVTLSKPQSGITAQEWKNFVRSRPELKLTVDAGHFVTAILDGDEDLALHFSAASGSVFTKNPYGPRIIEYMVSIAPHFGGVVTGDEGETYATKADWGTQADWDSRLDSQTLRRPWWRRGLSRGKRILLGVVFGVLCFAIKEFLTSK